jgi:CHASE3 domain sensor protein
MTDIIRDDAARWRQLCQTAYFEFEPMMLLQRVAEARSAVLDRIEDNLSKASTGEQHELHNALETLSILKELAERDISELKKTIQARSAGYARSKSREVI